MQIDNSILTTEEKICYKLRGLYRDYGYSCFKMSKFEEYDLYAKNKDYLISDGVITFTDTDGRLLALKPDVTLSIVKNTPLNQTGVSRLYYHENVYRISDTTKRFKELMQVGLECLGEITYENVCETAYLSALSLKEISGDSVLVLSNLDILSKAVSGLNIDSVELIKLVGEKNVQGVKNLCENAGISESKTNLLTFITKAEGDAEKVKSELEKITDDVELINSAEQLVKLTEYCKKAGVKIKVDLSLVGDMNYYNGIIFNGFIKGVPSRILSGGEYDKLMSKMGKNAKAVGFAVYADLLERL